MSDLKFCLTLNLEFLRRTSSREHYRKLRTTPLFFDEVHNKNADGEACEVSHWQRLHIVVHFQQLSTKMLESMRTI